MKRYPNESTRRFDQQFAETTYERNARLRKPGRSKLVYDKTKRTIVAVATGALTPEDAKTLAEIRERFAYQEAERFVTGHEEDIRFLLSLVSALSDNLPKTCIADVPQQRIVIMTPEEYAPGDWCSAEIVAARNLWDWHNPSKPVAELPGPIEDAWLIYLPIARVALYESLSLLADWESGTDGDYEYYMKLKTSTRAALHAIFPNRPDGESTI